ncbi:MAG: hypothetical protein L6427_07070 [Actinomycetia bacterium]|nr:hypothetical protein [Actinomycetes bacterium]
MDLKKCPNCGRYYESVDCSFCGSERGILRKVRDVLFKNWITLFLTGIIVLMLLCCLGYLGIRWLNTNAKRSEQKVIRELQSIWKAEENILTNRIKVTKGGPTSVYDPYYDDYAEVILPSEIHFFITGEDFSRLVEIEQDFEDDKLPSVYFQMTGWQVGDELKYATTDLLSLIDSVEDTDTVSSYDEPERYNAILNDVESINKYLAEAKRLLDNYWSQNPAI